jgi:hypothetical protein
MNSSAAALSDTSRESAAAASAAARRMNWTNTRRVAGRAALEAMITQQPQIIAYIDDYKLLMIATLLTVPLIAIFKTPTGRNQEHASVEL